MDTTPVYEVAFVAEPPATDWLHLPALHAQLLPLAQLLGHERLVLRAEIGTTGPVYEAYGAGGVADFHAYVLMGRPGCEPAAFAQALTERLQTKVDKLGGSLSQF